MSLDELAREATATLREDVGRGLDPQRMLASVRRTRTRRRKALATVPIALAGLVAATVWTGTRPEHPAPASRPVPIVPRANGVLLGEENRALAAPKGMHVPPLGPGSSPTWSPDGSQIAVLAGGILITDVTTGAQRSVPCTGCTSIAWSPDGTRFAALESLHSRIDLVDAGSGAVTHVRLSGVRPFRSPAWSPDGRSLAFVGDAKNVHHGAYVADLEDGSVTEIFTGPDVGADAATMPSGAMSVSWSVRDRIAVLAAHQGSGGRFAPFRLTVLSTAPDGTDTSALAADGTCACAGWAPNLTWSPDGTTLAVYSQHPRSRSVVDGDGSRVHLRFVDGSLSLAWQPR